MKNFGVALQVNRKRWNDSVVGSMSAAFTVFSKVNTEFKLILLCKCIMIFTIRLFI